jgi:predicted HAD superfamily phosphohydrolase YqeG
MELLARAIYTITKGLARRRELRRALLETGCGHVTQLSGERLAAEGCLILVLDFDGVLAPHGFGEPLPEVIAWLDRCVRFPGLRRVYVLSNKPSPAREAFFRRMYPVVRFVRDVRKKPYPDGLAGIIAAEEVRPQQVLIVDDRLLTGILAAVLADAKGICITEPYRDFRKETAAELFFAVLRRVERFLVKIAG